MSDELLILVDVDGVLNAFVRPGQEWQSHRIHGYHMWLNPGHGAALLDLAAAVDARLVWATAWEHDANVEIGPRVGLPTLPVIEVGFPRRAVVDGVLWKTPVVADYVQGRPFLWFDDDLTDADTDYLAACPTVGDFIIMHVDGDTGLTRDHLAVASAWLAEMRNAAA